MFVLFSLLVLTLISAKTVSQTRQVTNLSAFTKLYGYVKHFHPSDEAQAIDWDKFSVFGARQVQNAANDQELTAILKTLFLPVAPTLELSCAKAAFGDKPVSDNPDLSHICWQYQGFNNNPDSVYRSIRTNRSFQIPKQAQRPGSLSVLSIPIEELKADFEQLRFSLTITKATADTQMVKLGLVYNDDIVYESLKTFQWERKSVTWDKSSSLSQVVALYLFDISPCYLDSLKVELYAEHKWKTIYTNEFDADKPGLMPAGMNVNINPANSVYPYSDIDILIKDFAGNNVIQIKVSDTDLPYTMA